MSNNEKLLDELRRLHNDLMHGSDGGCFDICGLVGQAAERIEGLERQLEAAVEDTPRVCGTCCYENAEYRGSPCFACMSTDNNQNWQWRNAGMEGKG